MTFTANNLTAEKFEDDMMAFFHDVPLTFARLESGQHVLAFSTKEEAEDAAKALQIYRNLTFTLEYDAPIAWLLMPVLH